MRRANVPPARAGKMLVEPSDYGRLAALESRPIDWRKVSGRVSVS